MAYQARTFCYITDNVETCLKCFYENLAVNDVINIGSDKEISILDLARLIISRTKSGSNIVHLPPLKEGDMRRRLPDNARMKDILNRELIPLEEGLQHLIETPHFIIK